METPVTEAANHLTTTIDVASPHDIVEMLHMCDREIFNGWKSYKGLYDPETITTISNIAKKVVDILKDSKKGLVVLSGCGTSGRIAFVVSRTFNEILRNSGKESCFRYLIAGRDKALFTSQEAPEDDPQCGEDMLKQVCKGKDKVLFIGITCGLSAPFVAGQLNYCLENLQIFTPVLLGFNPTQLARNITIENWNKTFMDVVKSLERVAAENKAYILNPVVGPEPITGSSRMKSGSATKILLETIFTSALEICTKGTSRKIETYLKCYQEICEAVYKVYTSISSLVQLAGKSLIEGGSITYVGWDSLGIMGMIDASECPPTYGASLDDIRGFLSGGYKSLQNVDGDLSKLGKYFKISMEDFESDILSNLNESDLVILLKKDESSSITNLFWKSKCKKACLCFHSLEKIPSQHKNKLDCIVSINPPQTILVEYVGLDNFVTCNQMYHEMATKWVCNAITTGAHVLKGKVYQNIMVDLKVSNNKLFHRAVGIIQRFTSLEKDKSREYLLKSIYETDELSIDQKSLQIKDHIYKATPMEKVVPVALVAAILQCSIKEAKRTLSENPVIQTAISTILKQKPNK